MDKRGSFTTTQDIIAFAITGTVLAIVFVILYTLSHTS